MRSTHNDAVRRPSEPSAMSPTPIRRAQMIAPFGVGSLYTAADGVAMIVGGLDHWFKRDDGSYADVDLDEFRVPEWRLQRILGVGQLRLPPDHREPFGYGEPNKTNMWLSIPMLRFPRWHFCARSSCRALIDKPQVATGRQFCPQCDQQEKTGRKGGRRSLLAQVPFMAVCSNGHCQDFPWREWVHRSVTPPACGGNLRLVATGGASLSAQRVECDCGVPHRTLSGVTEASLDNGEEKSVLSSSLDDNALFLCSGQRPWLGDLKGEGCGRSLRGSLRSAINVYYAHVESSIFIPQTDSRINEKLEEILSKPPISTWITTVNSLGLEPNVDLLRNGPDGILVEPFSDKEVEAGLKAQVGLVPDAAAVIDDQVPDDQATQRKIRQPEFLKLRDDLDARELSVRRMDPALYEDPVRTGFGRINLVDSLRETHALYGFSRVVPATRTYKQHRASLWLDEPPQFARNWLPAYVVNGEGLYFELDEARLELWEPRYTTGRLEVLRANDARSRERRGLPPRDLDAALCADSYPVASSC